MLRIVMDTAGDLSEGWQEEFQIDLIPINIIHEGKTYLQGINLGYEEFYRLVESSSTLPTTSQPTPYQFVEFYRKIAKPGDTILSIHITEKLSGTMSSARKAAEELKNEFNIIPFDSASGTISMGMMAKEAREMDRDGKSLDEIIRRLEFIRMNTKLVFTLDTLKFASLSGRVKYLQASLASLLKVKPMIELKDGIIVMGEKVRSRAKSIDKLLEKMKQKFGKQRIKAAVIHARDREAGLEVLHRLISQNNCAEAILSELTISLAAHFGPGTLGIVAYPVE
ncbi:MAG: DegV family protein [Anaerolineaceae bacterium]|nr:DegV family protein [Anaerolineaceae bacterium]